MNYLDDRPDYNAALLSTHLRQQPNGVSSQRPQITGMSRDEYAAMGRQDIPVTLVEHMTDPRAAQLQMMFASLDERGKKTIVAMAATMVKLHKDGNYE